LWTMSYEMFGSLVVFCLCASHPYIRDPVRVYGTFAVCLVLSGNYIGLFIVGYCLALMRTRRDQTERKTMGPVGGGMALVVLLVSAVGALMSSGQVRHVLTMIEAIAICQVAYRNDLVRRTLSAPVSAWLGRISFAMYWVQFALLVSLYSMGVVYLSERGQLTAVSGLALALLVTMACVLAAVIGTFLEERLLRSIKSQLGRLLVSDPASKPGVSS
jgi:peptidoglycan/LPS O-acetylase OafA/YrhL